MKAIGRFAVLATVTGAVLLVPATAFAHPLGNATINRADAIVVRTDSIAITHVLDLAEIPTVQATPKMDADGDGQIAATELEQYATSTCESDAASSELVVDGSRATLKPVAAEGELREGQADLQILRITCGWTTNVDIGTQTSVAYTAAELNGTGWREVIANGDQTTLEASDVPTDSASDLLTRYPADQLTSPPALDTASFSVTPGGPALVAPDPSSSDGSTSSRPGITDRTTEWLTGLADRTLSPFGAILALLAAAVVGAVHALTPGHGKTAVAFAIAGQERSRMGALTVGLTVTATHTASVLVLGLLVASTTAVTPISLYPWLGAASGILVLIVGWTLLRRAWRGDSGHVHLGGHTHSHDGPGGDHGHDHAPDHHDHGHPPDHHSHDHSHDHGRLEQPQSGHVIEAEHPHEHTHEPARARAGRGGLVALGIAGGVVPSPSALLVLLGTAAVGRAWWGVALVIAFGIGMAVTLAAAGLLAWRIGERVRQWATLGQRRGVAGLARVLPVIAASGVCGAGILVVARSVMPLV